MPVKITDLNEDGRGRGQLDGRTVLVSQTLPGDTVDIQVDRQSRTTIQGRVKTLIGAKIERRSNGCGHAFECTGCPFLAAPEEIENAFKVDRLKRWLRRVGDDALAALKPLERPSELFSYRYYSKQVVGLRNGRMLFGSYVTGTHQLADNAGCPVLAPELAEFLENVRHRLDGLPVHGENVGGLRYVVARLSRYTGQKLLVVVTSRDLEGLSERLFGLDDSVSCFVLHNSSAGNRILDGEATHLQGPAFIEESSAGSVHRVGPFSFFQVNPVSAERLFEIAIQAAGTGSRCVEGYAGVGVLTLPLMTRFASVVANELNPEAVKALRNTGAEVEAGAAEEVLPRLLRSECDAVVLDPPRKGLGAEVATAVAESNAKKVVLLSCDPSSLVRDLPILMRRYRVAAVWPVDQFPRTAHVETVTELEAIS